MKPSLARKIIDAVLLLTPIVGAIVASAAVRAAEPPPTVTITALDPDATEAGHAAVLIATLDSTSVAQPLVIPIKLGGTATPGADYVSPGASITFPPHTPMALVKITPVTDALVEGTESVVVSLVANASAYTLGKENSATATITDAPGSAAGTAGAPGKTGPVDPPGKDHADRTPASKPTGTLTVELTLDGQGTWKSPYKDGAYSQMKFHRTMKYTLPLEGYVGAGSGFTDIDRRDVHPAGLPNFQRFVALAPKDLMTRPAGTPCGKGDVAILDEYKGMEVGDPGQPPLVPYVETWKGGGVFPSGDKTVPERDLCMTRFALDTEKHVVHILIDGSDSHVKTQIVHNGFASRPVNERFQGDNLDTSAKDQLTFHDVPVPAGAKSFEFSRTIENFSEVTGKGKTRVPLRATVKWRLTMP